jgi:membrane protein implicated in regulation of membrane protease activity
MKSVFLGCFLFGFLMVVASVVLGFAQMTLPGLEGLAHADHGGAHAADAGTHLGVSGEAAAPGGHHGLPLWNVSSLLAFLMWFGAAGYAAVNWLGLAAPLALIPAIGVGLAGAALLSAFLRFALRGETVMKPADYRIEGTIGRVTVSIPEGGTGEIVFSKGDRRRSEGARSLDGRPIPRGEEVVVVEYERGIAVVQRWQDFVGER